MLEPFTSAEPREATAEDNVIHVSVLNHPLGQHYLAKIRAIESSSEQFRNALRRLATLLMIQATQSLPAQPVWIQTPMAKAQAQVLSSGSPIVLAPILRAGLALSDVALDLLPEASVYHIGLYRNEATLEPVTYYNKLPDAADLAYGQARVFLLDPMLATGGSASAAVSLFNMLGVANEQIHLVGIIAAPEGLSRLAGEHPGLHVTVAAVDEQLNDIGYIVPGLGDAGDRTFGTL
ncbi:MAG: uracil phosphoribosyltransferase [Vampirovibrionales bacterium]|nr:uracil phosphoribosyltransferase [Vampirovibrionales bacterium]